MGKLKVSRRRFVANTAALSSAMVAAPFVRGAYAAGKLAIGFWDHWVPGANEGAESVARAWAEKEKVDLQIDFITSQGNKLILTAAAETQARSGHDILAIGLWDVGRYSGHLAPVDDIMAAAIKQNGEVSAVTQYLSRIDGKWLAVPATPGSQFKGPVSRIDLMKELAGIDVQAMYPAGAPPKADDWTYDTFLEAAAACHKGGHPFGIGLDAAADSVDTCGAIFQGFGAELVNEKGEITVKSDNVKAALEYWKQLAPYLPPEAPSFDNSSNNKMLIAGHAAMIMNPPSAWAVARRDKPEVAEQLWHHGMAAGPAGRYGPFAPTFWALWKFSKNQSAAKSLLTALTQPEAIATMVKASAGYDIPAFANLKKLKVWEEEGPPKGTLYHYCDPYNDQILSIAGAPAPHKIAVQIYRRGLQTQMVVRYAINGEPMNDVLSHAESELEGYMRG